MPYSKVCVIYHYYEVDQSYKENFLHFMLFGYDEHLDYFIIISGQHSLTLPAAANIRYIHTENFNHDYGGYSAAMNGTIPIEAYEHFIFVNSSVRGPYLPAYLDKPWYELFLDLLRDDIGLAGTTINILSPAHAYTEEFRQRHGGAPPYSHVQSMAFATRREHALLLKEKLFIVNAAALQKTHIITDFEILMSQTLIRGGWNIRCLLPEYNTVDYRERHGDINPTSVNGDPCFEGAYFGRTMHPYECLFIKTNRNLFPAHFLAKITYSMIQSRVARRHAFLHPVLERHLEEHTRSVDFSAPMPSILDQVAHVKLAAILNSINSILTDEKK